MQARKKKVGLGRAIGWGITDSMGGGSGTIMGTYLLFFLTTYAGLPALQAASIFGISRLVDMGTNIVVGSLTDNFYKTKLGQKYGRRRFFLLIGSPLMLIFGLMWLPGLPFLFYLSVYMMFDMLDSIVMIPYVTMPSEMTDDYDERTLMSTTRMFFSGLTGTVATTIAGILLAVFGEDNSMAYTIMGAGFAIYFMIVVFITYKSTWERPYTPEMLAEINNPNHEKLSIRYFINLIKQELIHYFTTLKVRAFRQHLSIYLLALTAQDIFSQLFVYFVVFDLLKTASFASALLAVGIIGLPFTPIWGLLFVKIGPKNLYSLSFSLVILLLAAFTGLYYFKITGHLLIALAFIISAAYQVFKGILYFVPWNVFPFIPDIDQIMTRQRREGHFAGMMNFSRKATGSVAALVVGFCLTQIHFQSGASTQTVGVQTGLANLILFGVGGVTIVAWLIATRFNLNKKNHSILVAEIARLEAGGSKDSVDPETEKVVESLTGIPYSEVWPEKVNK